MKKLTATVALVIVSIIFIYASYMVAKSISYTLFYEDMVQQTIREMVKPEYLRGGGT